MPWLRCGVVVLGLGKAVVDEQRDPALQPVGQRADKSLGLGMDLGEVVVRAFGIERRAQIGGPVGPCEPDGGFGGGFVRLFCADSHAPLVPGALHAVQQLDGHGTVSYTHLTLPTKA